MSEITYYRSTAVPGPTWARQADDEGSLMIFGWDSRGPAEGWHESVWQDMWSLTPTDRPEDVPEVPDALR